MPKKSDDGIDRVIAALKELVDSASDFNGEPVAVTASMHELKPYAGWRNRSAKRHNTLVSRLKESGMGHGNGDDTVTVYSVSHFASVSIQDAEKAARELNE